MKLISLAIIVALLSGCIMLEHGKGHGLKGYEQEYWKADGTSYGFDDYLPIEGPDYVCFGTYASCQHTFTQQDIVTEFYEPPVSPIDPNSNITPPLNSLPGQ